MVTLTRGEAGDATADTPSDAVAVTPAPPTVARLIYVESDPDSGTGARAEGFPALSADGRTLVVMAGPENHPSGADRVAVVFLDGRTGARAREIEVLSAEEFMTLRGDPPLPRTLTARVRGRVQSANEALEALHLSPLPFAEIGRRDDDGSFEGTGHGYSLRSTDADGLTVRRDGPTGPVILHRRLPAMPGGSPSCRGVNYPEVRGFSPVGPDRLLVLVGHHGNDTCWEGSDVWLLVTVPHP